MTSSECTIISGNRGELRSQCCRSTRRTRISRELVLHFSRARRRSCSSASVSTFTNGMVHLPIQLSIDLLLTDCHRYKIRGIRNLLFYGPPDHPQYFTEYLSYPFLDDDVDASDVTCRVLYSKYDWMKLERVAGTEAAAELVKV